MTYFDLIAGNWKDLWHVLSGGDSIPVDVLAQFQFCRSSSRGTAAQSNPKHLLLTVCLCTLIICHLCSHSWKEQICYGKIPHMPFESFFMGEKVFQSFQKNLFAFSGTHSKRDIGWRCCNWCMCWLDCRAIWSIDYWIKRRTVVDLGIQVCLSEFYTSLYFLYNVHFTHNIFLPW